MPSASEPIRIIMVSSSGVNRLGSAVRVVSGFAIAAICGIISPKKPPVIAPNRKVDTPHMPRRESRYFVPPSFVRIFRSAMSEARIIRMP